MGERVEVSPGAFVAPRPILRDVMPLFQACRERGLGFEDFFVFNEIYNSIADSGKRVSDLPQFRHRLNLAFSRDTPLNEAVDQYLLDTPYLHTPSAHKHLFLASLFWRDELPYDSDLRDRPLLVGEIRRFANSQRLTPDRAVGSYCSVHGFTGIVHEIVESQFAQYNNGRRLRSAS